MVKDKRYKVVKKMIEAGEIVEFSQIFDYIPVRVVADDLGSGHKHISELRDQPIELRLREIRTLSKLIDVEMDVMYAVSMKQILSIEAKAAKKKKK